MEYRREIDGLRALAVVPVILFHAGFKVFSGGFVGVDIFFVISGYLITSIIATEMASGQFSIARFYERRAKRILPVLFFVMLACVPLAWLWMLPHQLKDFSKSLFATALFMSNLFFYISTDYFNESADAAPLLHTWSLAVEEQYYVFFPLLILITWRFGPRVFRWLLFALGLASLVLAEWGLRNDASAVFYLLPTRGWELLVGAYAAVGLSKNQTNDWINRKHVQEFGSLAGFTLVCVSLFAFDKHTPFPGVYALLPTLGTVMIIVFSRPTTLVGRVLGTRAFVGVGLISYSAYLWHQPLLAFARLLSPSELSNFLKTVICLSVLPLSYMTWAFIERPLRFVKVPRSTVFGITGLSVVLFSAAGYWGYSTDGFLEYQLSRVEPEFRKVVIDRNAELSKRTLIWNEKLKNSARSFSGEASVRKILILGDSKSEDLFVSTQLLESAFQVSTFRRIRIDDECMGALADALRDDSDVTGDAKCVQEIGKLQASGLLNAADEIVLSATWQVHTVGDAVKLGRYLANSGKSVSFVSTANFYDLASLSMSIAKQKMNTTQTAKFVFQNIRQDWNKHSLLLKSRVEGLDRIRFLEKLDLFCDQSKGVCDVFSQDGKPDIFDTGHVTVNGAGRFALKMREANWFQ